MDINYKNLNLKVIVPAAIVIIITIAAAGYYLYTQKPFSSQQNGNNPQQAQQSQEEVNKLVAEVGKLVSLPVGETPTVATVTDISKLKDQPFFQKAKNGDKVLIYSNAKKAILYDPRSKKILDITQINLGTQSALPDRQAGQTASPTPVPTVTPKASPTSAPTEAPKPTP